jgi:hypothetical protein
VVGASAGIGRHLAVAQVILDTYLSALVHPGIGVEHRRVRSPSPVAGSVAAALGLDSTATP